MLSGHIGEHYFILSAYNTRLYVLKNTNNELLVLSNSYNNYASVTDSTYTLHNPRDISFNSSSAAFFWRSWKLYNTVENSLLVLFSSYSQIEWRYLRHFVGAYAYGIMVLTARGNNADIVTSNAFSSLRKMLTGYILSVGAPHRNISISSFIHDVSFAYLILSRSRSDINTHHVSARGSELEASNDVYDHIFDGHNVLVEEQLTIAGLFSGHNMLTAENVPGIVSYDYYGSYLCRLPALHSSIIGFVFNLALLPLYVFYVCCVSYAFASFNIRVLTSEYNASIM